MFKARDILDHCTHRYTAGYAVAEGLTLMAAVYSMIRVRLTLAARVLASFFRRFDRGMASARDVSGAVSGIRGAQEFGSELGGGLAEIAERP